MTEMSTTMKPETKTLKLDQIRIDGGTQPRAAIDEQVLKEYAENYCTGVDMPPLTVFFDGANYWLADGFHRYWANKNIDCEYIFADVYLGTLRQAILFSAGANATHGLRRTNQDKRRAILTLLKDEEWSQWSDREIARRCGVSDKTVGSSRKSLTAEIPQSESQPRTYKTRHGTVSTMNTANNKRGKSKHSSGVMKPVRVMGRTLPKTNLDLPHNPADGARAIVSAMGEEYAGNLIESLKSYLQQEKEGDA